MDGKGAHALNDADRRLAKRTGQDTERAILELPPLAKLRLTVETDPRGHLRTPQIEISRLLTRDEAEGGRIGGEG